MNEKQQEDNKRDMRFENVFISITDPLHVLFCF